jgi:hypothetical protein
MKRFLLPATMVTAILLGVGGAARAQSDILVGTWMLDVPKSKYLPGPPPVAERRIYAPEGHSLRVTIDSVDSGGHHVALRYLATEDGKDCPMSGLTFADAVAMRRINSNAFDVDTKKDGKVIATTHVEISKDGKIMTLTSKMVAQGHEIDNVGVFEKQP